jgi:transcriptional regulator with XRE-family HTH domain
MTSYSSRITPMELKAWRRRLGLTQRQASERLGVPALTLSGWETGRLTIKRPRMLALACWALELEQRTDARFGGANTAAEPSRHSRRKTTECRPQTAARALLLENPGLVC